jgi:hypothetical protein
MLKYELNPRVFIDYKFSLAIITESEPLMFTIDNPLFIALIIISALSCGLISGYNLYLSCISL